ncbi:hypothetical protein EFS06_04985 [Levilactobacillus brevis]|nr:hypothetical protein [Levilactobacillus brevis]
MAQFIHIAGSNLSYLWLTLNQNRWLRHTRIINRFRNDYPKFYQCYELDHNYQKNNHLAILQQNSVANLATKLKW